MNTGYTFPFGEPVMTVEQGEGRSEHPTPRSGASIEFIPPWRDIEPAFALRGCGGQASNFEFGFGTGSASVDRGGGS